MIGAGRFSASVWGPGDGIATQSRGHATQDATQGCHPRDGVSSGGGRESLGPGGRLADDEAVKVYLDDEPLKVADARLGTALEAGVARARGRGRIVVEVLVDGSPAPASDIERPPERAPYAAEVRLVSAEPRSLVRTTLHDAADALEDAREAQAAAAERLQRGETADALGDLSRTISIWESVRRAMEDGAELIGDGSGGAPDIGPLLDGLAERLVEIRRALTAQDWSALADALAYDMEEQADVWWGALTAFADSLKATVPPEPPGPPEQGGASS